MTSEHDRSSAQSRPTPPAPAVNHRLIHIEQAGDVSVGDVAQTMYKAEHLHLHGTSQQISKANLATQHGLTEEQTLILVTILAMVSDPDQSVSMASVAERTNLPLDVVADELADLSDQGLVQILKYMGIRGMAVLTAQGGDLRAA